MRFDGAKVVIFRQTAKTGTAQEQSNNATTPGSTGANDTKHRQTFSFA